MPYVEKLAFFFSNAIVETFAFQHAVENLCENRRKAIFMETTQNTANVDFFELWNQSREQYVKSPCVRKETSDTLLPFISTVHTHHVTQLEGLKTKSAATKERITGLEKELQHLQNSVDQFKDNVTMQINPRTIRMR